MLSAKSLLLCLLVCFEVARTEAQQDPLVEITRSGPRFDHLYFNDPSDKYSVEDIVIDSMGFIWIGAKEGLFRYDGNQFVSIGELVSGLQDELRVLDLFRDRSGHLWILSGVDLYLLDTDSLSLKKYELPLTTESELGNLNRGEIYVDDEGMIYGGFWGGGLWTFHPGTKAFNHFYEDPRFPVSGNTVTSFSPGNDRFLFVGTHNGIFRYDRNKESFGEITPATPASEVGVNQINCLMNDHKGVLWAGTNGGLIKLYLESGERRMYRFDLNGRVNYDNNVVESIDAGRDGTLWIGTRFGLHKLDTTSGKMTSFYHDENENASLSANYVRKVLEDPNGILWIGHRYGTISKLTPRNKAFVSCLVLSAYPEAHNVHSVFKDDREVWFGTGYGLYRMNRETGSVMLFRHDPNDHNSISNDFVSGISRDARGTLWVSTDKGGLNRMDQSTGKFTNIFGGSNEPASFSESDIWYMTIADNGTIWCGTGGSGLLSYDPSSGSIATFSHDPSRASSLSSNFIGPVIEDENGLLWVGTIGSGLNHFDPLMDTARHFKRKTANKPGLANDGIVSLHLNRNGMLWIGTVNGLSMLNTLTGDLQDKVHSIFEGMRIEGIEQDETGQLWISTQNGLLRYNPVDSAYRQYMISDGISDNRFISGSSFAGDDGELLFGSANGLTSFYPSDIIDNPAPPPVYITDFRVNGRSLMNDRARLQDLKRYPLKLKYDRNNLGIDFCSLDFMDPEKNRFMYTLENYDIGWKDSEGKRSVEYQNLPPGAYRFRVRGSNNDNIWNLEGDALRVTIRPPFWETLGFRISLLAFILLGIYLLIDMRIRSIRNQKVALEALVRQRTRELEKQKLAVERQKAEIEEQAVRLKEIDRLKSTFFANISHEFRTPLTLILNAVSGKANKNTGSNSFNDSIIQTNTHRLIRLIDQLLDLTRIESGFMKLGVSSGDPEHFISAISHAFSVRASSSGIDYTTAMGPLPPSLYLDWDKLEKILYNLLSNAFKFTPGGGSVSLDASVRPEIDQHAPGYLEIVVSDTGPGIPEDLQEKIFSRFYQVKGSKNRQAGTGIGLALTLQLVQLHRGKLSLDSTPGKGSSFRVLLPCQQSLFDPEEVLPEGTFDLEFISDNILETIGREQQEDTPAETETADASHPVFLFADDNDELCRMVQSQLSPHFRVMIAGDGKTAFDLAMENIPDIIVSDISMPGMSGIDLCRKLKKDIRTDHIPFIIVTAIKDKVTESEALGFGADDYVTKPFSLETLLMKIQNQFETRRNKEKKLAREFNESAGPEAGGGAGNTFISRVVGIVNRNMDNPEFSVSDLAEALHMSRTQLYRKFGGSIAIPVNEFIKDVRLKKARQLLLTGEYHVNEVAAICGFSTPGYFSRCFEQKYGTLPSRLLS